MPLYLYLYSYYWVYCILKRQLSLTLQTPRLDWQ